MKKAIEVLRVTSGSSGTAPLRNMHSRHVTGWHIGMSYSYMLAYQEKTMTFQTDHKTEERTWNGHATNVATILDTLISFAYLWRNQHASTVHAVQQRCC